MSLFKVHLMYLQGQAEVLRQKSGTGLTAPTVTKETVHIT